MVQSRIRTQEKAAKDYETLKLHAARWCWKRKYEWVPPANKITWEEWVNEKWGETLQEYASKKIQEKADGQNNTEESSSQELREVQQT